jgi:hypothetical protein
VISVAKARLVQVLRPTNLSGVAGPDEPEAADSDAALLDAIDAALAEPRLPRLASPLDGRYRAFVAATRRISIREWLSSLVVVQTFGFAADAFACPDHIG